MADASEAPPKLVLGPRRERFPLASPSPLTWNCGAPRPPKALGGEEELMPL